MEIFIFLIIVCVQTYWVQCRLGKQNEDLLDTTDWLSEKVIEYMKKNEELREQLKNKSS